MLLIVEDDWATLLSYRNILATFRKVEGIDFIYARSFEEARDVFRDYSDHINVVIVDHHLDSGKTGLDVVRAIRERSGIEILRCSSDYVRGYPLTIPYFNKQELREVIKVAVDFINFNESL